MEMYVATNLVSRGRGQGPRRPYNRGFNFHRSQDQMSQDDKNFLFGYCPDEDDYISPNRRKTVKSPSTDSRQMGTLENKSSVNSHLTEYQRQCLIDLGLGLAPDSGFVRQAAASMLKASTKV